MANMEEGKKNAEKLRERQEKENYIRFKRLVELGARKTYDRLDNGVSLVHEEQKNFKELLAAEVDSLASGPGSKIYSNKTERPPILAQNLATLGISTWLHVLEKSPSLRGHKAFGKAKYFRKIYRIYSMV